MDRLSVNCIRLLAMASTVLAVVGCAQDREQAGPVQPAPVIERPIESNDPPEVSQAEILEDRWGIKIERAVLSAGGYMVDFRFRVLDVAKAAPILDRSIRPCLIDQATGARFIVPTPPKTGQLRGGGSIRQGAVYFIFFANPGRYVQSGNKVTVVVGDFEARDILVQ